MKLFAVIATLALSATPVWASAPTAAAINAAQVKALVQQLNNKSALIDWKVGDTASYDIKAAFGALGTMSKSVDREEGNTVWLHEETAVFGQNDVVELQIDRDTGQVLQMTHNGQPQDYPDEQPEITDQEVTTITVPAGTFKCVHLTFNTSQVQGAQLWANPKETVMDGAIKQVLPVQGLEISVELTSFDHGQ